MPDRVLPAQKSIQYNMRTATYFKGTKRHLVVTAARWETLCDSFWSRTPLNTLSGDSINDLFALGSEWHQRNHSGRNSYNSRPELHMSGTPGTKKNRTESAFHVWIKGQFGMASCQYKNYPVMV